MLTHADSSAECPTLRSYACRHRLRTSTLVASAIIASVTFLSGRRLALACSCIDVGEEASFAHADVVFRGELIRYEPPATAESMSTADLATWTFAVQEIYKGVAADEQDVVSAWSGSSCGLELPHEGVFYVFASHASAAQLAASACGGTRSVAKGPLAVADVTPRRVSSAAAGTSPAQDPLPMRTPAATAAPGPDAATNEPVAGRTGRILLASIGLVVLVALLGARAAGMRRGASSDL